MQPFLRGTDAQKNQLARIVDEACRDVGFLLVTGHGVPTTLCHDTENALARFFSLPLEVKRRWSATRDNVRGYRAMNQTTLSKSKGQDSPPDLMERFTIGQFDVPDDEYHRSRRWFQDSSERHASIIARWSDLRMS